jgi:hypothetical protein
VVVGDKTVRANIRDDMSGNDDVNGGGGGDDSPM